MYILLEHQIYLFNKHAKLNSLHFLSYNVHVPFKVTAMKKLQFQFLYRGLHNLPLDMHVKKIIFNFPFLFIFSTVKHRSHSFTQTVPLRIRNQHSSKGILNDVTRRSLNFAKIRIILNRHPGYQYYKIRPQEYYDWFQA